jgi:lipopolysaccharide/colanic/teichoic acid biosynthesis glycosyltransferase
VKKAFDFLLSFILLLFLIFPILLFWLLLTLISHSNGFFFQKRIGQYGKIFTIIKFRTIFPNKKKLADFGQLLRRYKIDEIPQLINILKGDMSFVGPRPDIEGYYDLLTGEQRKILDLKPGLTSEASIKYVNEEEILLKMESPDYNDKVIFPDKVKMNLDYYYKQNFFLDLKIILKTIFRKW